MMPDEALLFRTFDSTADRGVTGKMTLHTAFDHPATVASSPQRESIECRLLAIWPGEEEDGRARL